MVISDAEKKILLLRLQKAREVKAAKVAAAKKAPAPIIEPPPAPEIVKEEDKQLPPIEIQNPAQQVETEIALPPKVKKEEKQQKREKCDNSSDESDNEKPVKKSSKTKKTKQTPYMKIKIFHEPKNHAALQNLIEAVQDNNDDDDDINSQEPPPFPRAHAAFEAPRMRHDIKNQTPKASKTLPTHQELMRRAAMDFFA